MGKLRLNCPNCGKAVAVSETAKKARCPGCKKVMDVAAALAGGLDPATELKGGSQAEEAPADAGGGEAPAEEGAAQAEAAEPKPSSRRASRRPAQEDAPEREAPPPPTFNLPAGAQPWMIIAAVAVILAAVLFLVLRVQWYAAIGIVSGLALYIDASLMRITRLKPSAQGTSMAPTVWGLIGFAPVVGVAIYALLRRKLVQNSCQDIAAPDMDEDDMSFEGKVRAPSIASVGMVLVLALAVAGGMLRGPASTWVKIGTAFSMKEKVLSGENPKAYYNAGELVAWFHGKSPLEDYAGLNYDVLRTGTDGVEVSVAADIVEPNIRARDGMFRFKVEEAGKHRLVVKDGSGGVLASCEFRVRRSR